MNALRPSAKKANQVSTTALRTIDSQLSKNRAVGLQARHRMKSGPTAMTKVRKSFESVTTKSAMQRKTTEPIEKTTAARTRSRRNMLASFMMSATWALASSLNLSSKAYGVVTVAGSTPRAGT
jgi:hypothetical protein